MLKYGAGASGTRSSLRMLLCAGAWLAFAPPAGAQDVRVAKIDLQLLGAGTSPSTRDFDL